MNYTDQSIRLLDEYNFQEFFETFPGIKYAIFNRGDLNLMATSKKF
jgi:hypothetical protein